MSKNNIPQPWTDWLIRQQQALEGTTTPGQCISMDTTTPTESPATPEETPSYLRSVSNELNNLIEQSKREVGITKDWNPIASLGIPWQSQEDAFTYNHLCGLKIAKPYTKTTVASVLARAAYDPRGQISPIVMEARKILRECWVRKLSWRQQLEDDLQTRFENWLKELEHLSDLTFRRYLPSGPEVEYHCLGDASADGVGSTIYARFQEEGEWKSKLLLARSRLDPLAPLTTLKANMKAAALTAELAATVKELFDVPDEKIFCWTDSQEVLCWLKHNPANLIPYLSHRVK